MDEDATVSVTFLGYPPLPPYLGSKSFCFCRMEAVVACKIFILKGLRPKYSF